MPASCWAWCSAPTTIRSKAVLQVTFHGAAETVTGSQHLIDMDGTQLLLDCGLFQGRRSESFARNRLPPYAVQQVQAVLLSHAHTDHSANLPTLARLGFAGTVPCACPDDLPCLLRDQAPGGNPMSQRLRISDIVA